MSVTIEFDNGKIKAYDEAESWEFSHDYLSLFDRNNDIIVEIPLERDIFIVKKGPVVDNKSLVRKAQEMRVGVEIALSELTNIDASLQERQESAEQLMSALAAFDAVVKEE